MSSSELWWKASEPSTDHNIWHSKHYCWNCIQQQTSFFPLTFFFFCICLTLSLTVKDNNYYFCRFLIESLKSVLSSWYALHIFNYIKVIKQNSVQFGQTHVFISLLIKSKPNSKSKMDQNSPFLFLFFLIREHSNDNVLNRNDDV